MNRAGYETRIDNLLDLAKRKLSKEEFEKLLKQTDDMLKMYKIRM